MFNRRFSARSRVQSSPSGRPAAMSFTLATAIAAAASSSSFAGGRGDGGGRGGPLPHFGMLHSPLGAATLSVNPDGSLAMGNIGSSGQDGVSIDLGHSQGSTVGLRVASGGNVACETIVCKMGRVELALAGSGTGTAQEFGIVMHDLGSGVASIGPHLLNLTCPRVAVACRLGGTTRDEAVFTPPFPPQLLTATLGATGDAGVEIDARAAIQNFTCEFVNGRYVLRAGVPIQVSVAGGPPAPADEIEIVYSIDRGNNENWLFGESTITGSVSAGTAALTELEARLKALGILARSIGGADIAGVPVPGPGDDDDCDLAVSNIGSSGQDGVEIDLRELARLGLPSNIGINEPIPDVTLHLAQPLEVASQGTGAQVRLHGVLDNSPDEVELARLNLQPLGGAIVVHGDMSAMGGTLLEVTALSEGQPTGVFTVPNNSSLGLLTPASTGTPKLSDFGLSRMGNPLINEIRLPVLRADLDRVCEYRAPGQPPVLCDELRVGSPDASHSVLQCTTTHFRVAGTPVIVCSALRLGPANGGIERFGITSLPIRGTLQQTVDGDLSATAPQGSTLPFGAAASLGAVQGASVTVGVPQSTALPILSRNILKTYFETGDIPTQDEFGDLIDSEIHRIDDGLTDYGVAVFGFNPQEVNAHARLAGQTVASASFGSSLPATIASIDSPSHSSVFTQGCSLHDVDGDGRPDLVRVVFSEPVAFSAALGSSGGSVAADEIVVEIQIEETDPVQACAIACLAEGLSSFSISDIAAVMFDRPHRAVGESRTHGAVCGQTSHFLVENIGSSGQDGVSVDISDPFNPPPHSAATGFTLDGSRSQDDGVIQSFTWTTTGRVGGTPPAIVSAASCELSTSGGGGHDIIVAPPAWMTADLVTRRAYLGDQLVAESVGGSLGTVASTVVPRVPDSYGFELVVVDSPLAAVSSNGVQHRFVWNSAVDLAGIATGPVLADRLVVRAMSSGGGGGSGGSVGLESATITGRGTVATCKIEVGITGESLLFHNFCPADISGDNNINVTDLLAVIGSWGPCSTCPFTPCPADTNSDCSINVTDLLAVIGGWGTCD